ncbi:trans-2-enoyl-CoA reductase family protein [Opitutaceae bacterium]|nr:trans-2-enoyl-CoA reductase family protein [bacterium]MDB4385023.1 trans-2-enoyl-CoA reductase family protein [Opitutaceae bacterium]
MVIKPRVRGFVCVTSHPEGCAAHIQQQIDYVKSKGAISDGPKNVLVIGSSTGFGLSSRVTAAFGCGANTMGVFFERPSEEDRLGTAGWYNTIALTEKARAEGLYARNFNGDAFSNEIKSEVIAAIKEDMGSVDLIIYSLASPRRTHPDTGAVHKSVLKPVGKSYSSRTVDTDKGIVSDVTIEPASDEEISDTVQVMGGEDWERWISDLDEAGLIAEGATSVAYSYIGPEVTWDIYKNGTIGLAKNHLEESCARIDAKLKGKGEGRALISVNKALVSQASSAIPVVPLYISILYKIMKAKGTHEGCIEQMQRLFAERLYQGADLRLDESGRIRIDDLEMQDDVQAQGAEIWPQVTTENLEELTDIAGYREEFLKMFGFGLPGIDYDAHTEPNRPMI